MIISMYPQCCKANIVHDFGGGHYYQRGGEYHTKQQVIAWLSKQMSKLKKDGIRILVAMPTSTQPNAIAALEELGFYGHPNPSKCHNVGSTHGVFPFFANLNEWNASAFNRRYKPGEDKYKNKPTLNFGGIDQIAADRTAARRRRW